MTFDEWFKRQRGPRPGLADESDRALALDAIAGKRAQLLIQLRRDYDAAREVASLAWQAAQKGEVTP